MQQESTIMNNSVTLVGEIVSDYSYSHEVYGEGFYTVNVNVLRLSDVSDILPVTISERILDRNKFCIGAKVVISGQIRSYNNFLESDKKNRLILTVFARDIHLFSEESANKNPNDVFLNGYICKKPVYRTTPFGREIVDLLLAVNRSYNKSDYIPCIAWGRNARFGGKLEVGDNLKIWGRMQSRKYQKKIGEDEIIEKTAYEVSVCKMEIPEVTVEEDTE